MGNGYSRMCVEIGGAVYCWGINDNGQLGDGSKVERHTAVQVVNITTATSVSARHGDHACATLADGTVQCWGSNGDGQLADGTTIYRLTPVLVSGITTATSVSAGGSMSGSHTCAMLADGTVQSWGYNGNGQLGDGTTTDRLTPVLVSGITTATSVSAGGGHTCATLADGTVQCWGYNDKGQLGDGTTTHRPTPVLVSGITTATSVSTGGAHTCAMLADGTVQCWGYNLDGRLGDGTKTNRLTPVLVSGITTATSVSAGGSHNCAMLADGTVQCWGVNVNGQLGDGTTTSSNIPVQVSNITTATSVSAGYDFNCATLAGDTVQCWGYNDKGQLGNNATAISNIPVQVLGITTTTSVSAGGSSGGGGVPGTIVPLRSADTLSDVEIAGIAVGCIAFVIILTLIGLCVRSRRRADDKLRARLGIPTRGAPVAVTPQQPQVIVIQT